MLSEFARAAIFGSPTALCKERPRRTESAGWFAASKHWCIDMRLYCCQTDITWENKTANYGRVHKLLSGTKPERDSLILLPEMFATGFSMNVPAIQEGAKADTEKFLAQLAQEFGVFVIGGVVASAPDGRGYNQALVIGPDGTTGARYSKMQPFSLGGEAKNYMAGDEPVFFAWKD